MGDSTAMTIEFLRARLLSERSISRAAKERADLLAKRVMELEEQLKIVTIQRKKAEKATAEVLAILEAQGIGSFSEITDSSSDQNEIPGCMKGCDDTFKEDGTSTASKMEKSEVDDALSGSELEVSPSHVGSLSWKGRTSSPDSYKKLKAKQIKQRLRRCSFMSNSGSSPKYHLGKSCRKIKLKEKGSAAEDDPGKHILNDAYAKTKVTWSYINGDQPDSRNEIENKFPDSLMPLPDKNEDADETGNGRGDEMERVLEQQAQLIGQYQAEENAQTEWERKFNKNKYTILGYCETGNQFHVTENGSEPQDEDTEHTDEKLCYDGEANTMAENLSTMKEPKAESLTEVSIVQVSHYAHPEKTDRSQKATTAALADGLVLTDPTAAPSVSNSHVHGDDFLGQQYDEVAVGEISGPSKGRTFANAMEKQSQKIKYDNPDSGASSNPNLRPPGNEILDMLSRGSSSAASSSSKTSKWGSSDVQNQSDMQLTLQPSSSLGGILEALKHAKVLLRKEIINSPSSSQDALVSAATRDSNSRANISDDALKIPMGSAGLFRLPTDSYSQAHFAGCEIDVSRLRLAATSPCVRYVSSTNGYPYPMSSHIESRSGVSIRSQSFDPFTGVPPSSGFARPCTDVKTGLPADHQKPAGRQTLPGRISITQTDVRTGIPGDYQNPTGRQPLPNEISKPHTDVRTKTI